MRAFYDAKDQRLKISSGEHVMSFFLPEKERIGLREALDAFAEGKDYYQAFDHLSLSANDMGVLITDGAGFHGMKLILGATELDALRRSMFLI